MLVRLFALLVYVLVRIVGRFGFLPSPSFSIGFSGSGKAFALTFSISIASGSFPFSRMSSTARRTISVCSWVTKSPSTLANGLRVPHVALHSARNIEHLSNPAYHCDPILFMRCCRAFAPPTPPHPWQSILPLQCFPWLPQNCSGSSTVGCFDLKFDVHRTNQGNSQYRALRTKKKTKQKKRSTGSAPWASR